MTVTHHHRPTPPPLSIKRLSNFNSLTTYHVFLSFSFNSAGLLWSGLIIANTEDACSYRWPHACTTPDWVAFQDAASTCSDNCLCGAVDVDMETVIIQCNENLQFICEYDSPGMKPS